MVFSFDKEFEIKRISETYAEKILHLEDIRKKCLEETVEQFNRETRNMLSELENERNSDVSIIDQLDSYFNRSDPNVIPDHCDFHFVLEKTEENGHPPRGGWIEFRVPVYFTLCKIITKDLDTRRFLNVPIKTFDFIDKDSLYVDIPTDITHKRWREICHKMFQPGGMCYRDLLAHPSIVKILKDMVIDNTSCLLEINSSVREFPMSIHKDSSDLVLNTKRKVFISVYVRRTTQTQEMKLIPFAERRNVTHSMEEEDDEERSCFFDPNEKYDEGYCSDDSVESGDESSDSDNDSDENS